MNKYNFRGKKWWILVLKKQKFDIISGRKNINI